MRSNKFMWSLINGLLFQIWRFKVIVDKIQINTDMMLTLVMNLKIKKNVFFVPFVNKTALKFRF